MSWLGRLARRIRNGVRRRLFPRRAYRKVPLRIRAPLANVMAPPPGLDWRACLHTIEVDEAVPLAGALFRRRFGTRMPASPRHFVLLYSPTGDAARGEAVAYIHHEALADIYLTGGLCVDERAYRSFPEWLFAQVRAEDGLATIVVKQSVAMLTGAKAVFAHVGDLRSRQASLRSGFEDTDDAHLMVYWPSPPGDEEKQRLTALAVGYGPF